MPQRRINDAQTERLLSALQSLEYRQKLAAKLAAKENVKYSSAMRRLQRYATKGAEKRSFAATPVAKRKQVIVIARGLPVPADFLPKSKLVPQRRDPEQLPLPRASFYREVPPSPIKPVFQESSFEEDAPDNYEYRALLAYFDGDADEAARTLKEFGAPARTADMLRLVATSVNIVGMQGSTRLGAAVLDWYEVAHKEDVRDIRDFSDLLREGDMAEWKVEIILEDLANGSTTFADWMDAWRNADLDYDELIGAEDNEYWRLWRAAYARAKK